MSIIFKVFGMTRPGIEPQSSRPLANTLSTRTMSRSKKQNTPKFDELITKIDVERFSCNNLLQDFKFMKNVKIAMDLWWNNRRKESLMTAYSAFLFLKILLRCCHVDWCLKFVTFLTDIREDGENNDSKNIFLFHKRRKRKYVYEDKYI